MYTKIKIKTLSMYVYLSVEIIMTNLEQLLYMFFILGLLSIEKLIQFDCCKGHLNKALIDQKHVYVHCLLAHLSRRLIGELIV